MGGIVACVNSDERPVTDTEVRALCAAAAHRGPAGTGVWTSGAAGLGYVASAACRAIDERQPFVPPAGERAVTFDGRLDNREELGRLLGVRGPVLFDGKRAEGVSGDIPAIEREAVDDKPAAGYGGGGPVRFFEDMDVRGPRLGNVRGVGHARVVVARRNENWHVRDRFKLGLEKRDGVAGDSGEVKEVSGNEEAVGVEVAGTGDDRPEDFAEPLSPAIGERRGEAGGGKSGVEVDISGVDEFHSS